MVSFAGEGQLSTFALHIYACNKAEGNSWSTAQLHVVILGLDYTQRPNSYELTTWSPGENYIEEYNGWFFVQQKEFFLGR